MQIQISLEGDREVKRALADPQLVAGPLKVMLAEAAFIVEAEAKELVPRDTGHLRDSIKTTLKPFGAIVGTPVVYAPHVEFGTRPHVI